MSDLSASSSSSSASSASVSFDLKEAEASCQASAPYRYPKYGSDGKFKSCSNNWRMRGVAFDAQNRENSQRFDARAAAYLYAKHKGRVDAHGHVRRTGYSHENIQNAIRFAASNGLFKTTTNDGKENPFYKEYAEMRDKRQASAPEQARRKLVAALDAASRQYSDRKNILDVLELSDQDFGQGLLKLRLAHAMGALPASQPKPEAKSAESVPSVSSSTLSSSSGSGITVQPVASASSSSSSLASAPASTFVPPKSAQSVSKSSALRTQSMFGKQSK